MSPQERFNFIDSAAKKSLGENDPAYVTWDALSATTTSKYELFKEAAASVKNNSWECKSMENLASAISAPAQSRESLPKSVLTEEAVFDR